MGRHRADINTDLMLELLGNGMNSADVAGALGVSPPTIHKRIEEIKREESALLAYDKVHHLDLISVKQRLLAGISDQKIVDAPLGQIAMAYGVFAKMEQLIQGRPTEIHGLMGYLMHLEKEEHEKMAASMSGDVVDAESSGDGCEQSTQESA